MNTHFFGPLNTKVKPFFIDTPTEMGSTHPFPHKNLNFQWNIYRHIHTVYTPTHNYTCITQSRLTYSLNHSITHSLIHSFTHSLIHSFPVSFRHIYETYPYCLYFNKQLYLYHSKPFNVFTSLISTYALLLREAARC